LLINPGSQNDNTAPGKIRVTAGADFQLVGKRHGMVQIIRFSLSPRCV
jgi:hypothetical protein